MLITICWSTKWVSLWRFNLIVCPINKLVNKHMCSSETPQKWSVKGLVKYAKISYNESLSLWILLQTFCCGRVCFVTWSKNKFCSPSSFIIVFAFSFPSGYSPIAILQQTLPKVRIQCFGKCLWRKHVNSCGHLIKLNKLVFVTSTIFTLVSL